MADRSDRAGSPIVALAPYLWQGVPIVGAIVVEVGYWTVVSLALQALIDTAAAGTAIGCCCARAAG